jgi:HD-like signal output (HDOD) protein
VNELRTTLLDADIPDYGRLEKADQILELLTDLPALPQVLLELIPLLDAPDVSAAQVAALVSRDPALVSRLLKLANSPTFHRGRDVTTVSQAVALLGLKQVKITAAFACLDLARGKRSSAGSREKQEMASVVWRNSLCAAIAAAHLSRTLVRPYAEEVFVGGLLHDLGKFALLQVGPEAYLDVAARVGDGPGLCELEEEVIGFSHPLVAALLTHQWRFAAETCELIRLHHAEHRAPFLNERAEKAAIVHAADLLAHCAGHGHRAGAPGPWEEMREALAQLSLPEERIELLMKGVIEEFEWQSLLE